LVSDDLESGAARVKGASRVPVWIFPNFVAWGAMPWRVRLSSCFPSPPLNALTDAPLFHN